MPVINDTVTQPIHTYGSYKFYEEYEVGSGGAVSCGNCIAVMATEEELAVLAKFECLSTFANYPDGPVVFTAVPRGYLEEFCKEVTEEQARRIHPKLFQFLDQIVPEETHDAVD